jgi:SOS-response transcriptional repressor LexA
VSATAPTRRQLDVLAYIFAHQQKNGVPPTVREICRHFGWSSENAAMGHLRALTELKLVERPAPRRYAIRVTDAGMAHIRARCSVALEHLEAEATRQALEAVAQAAAKQLGHDGPVTLRNCAGLR